MARVVDGGFEQMPPVNNAVANDRRQNFRLWGRAPSPFLHATEMAYLEGVTNAKWSICSPVAEIAATPSFLARVGVVATVINCEDKLGGRHPKCFVAVEGQCLVKC